MTELLVALAKVQNVLDALETAGLPHELVNPESLLYWLKKGHTTADVVAIVLGTRFSLPREQEPLAHKRPRSRTGV